VIENMPEKSWENFSHGADIGVRGIGATMEEAFEQAALALTGVITEVTTVEPVDEVKVECAAPDEELLLTEWLNELVYQMAVRRMLFSRFEVRMKKDHLTGRLWGEPVDVEKHKPAVEVKGATFTELKVGHDENGKWLAQCVVDV
jgi:SHS2 domain-containing protein